MSGAVVVTPSTGAAWSTAWEQFEGIRKGMISLSLTNYDATTVPQIASGSWIEAIGSIYKWTGDDSITGSLTSDAINYITMVPSGTGASAILTPTWSDSAPTWSDAYQGYYSGTTRYAGGCYYDGTNYVLKWVYTNRHAGPVSHPLNLGMVGVEPTNIVLNGREMDMSVAGATDHAYLSVFFPRLCVVTELKTVCTSHSNGTLTVNLRYSDDTGSATTMASCANSADGTTTDTSITDPIINQDDNHYYVHAVPSGANTSLEISELAIEITEIIRC